MKMYARHLERREEESERRLNISRIEREWIAVATRLNMRYSRSACCLRVREQVCLIGISVQFYINGANKVRCKVTNAES